MGQLPTSFVLEVLFYKIMLGRAVGHLEIEGNASCVREMHIVQTH